MKQTLSGNIIDIHARRIYGGTVTIDDGRIVAVEEDGRTYDRYLAPGLVDAHVHIESSMLTPEEFARTVIAHGTVAVVSDPHENANVMGPEGISFMEGKNTWHGAPINDENYANAMKELGGNA